MKVLIKISDKTPQAPSCLQFRVEARHQPVKQWISVPSCRATNPQLLFASHILQHALHCFPYVAVGFVLFFKYEPNKYLVVHLLNYVFAKINRLLAKRAKNQNLAFFTDVPFPAQDLLDALMSIRLVTFPHFLCFGVFFGGIDMISPIVVESALAHGTT